MRRLLIIVLVLVSVQINQVKANQPKFFIDDIIDNIKDQIDKRFTPFFIKIKDVSSDKETVSYENRKLRFKLFYRDDLVRAIRNISDDELENAINEYLELETETEEGFSSINVRFQLENKKIRSSTPSYFEAHFISRNLVLDEPQKITANFDVDDFMDEFNINSDLKDNIEEDILRIKPIIIEVKKDIIFTPLDESFNAETDYVTPQRILFSFKKAVELESPDSIEFSTYRKGKLKKSFAKFAKKKFILEPELQSDLSTALVEGEENYSGYIDLRFDLSNSSKAFFFRTGRELKLLVPFSLETTTTDGLKARIKVFSKVKVRVP